MCDVLPFRGRFKLDIWRLRSLSRIYHHFAEREGCSGVCDSLAESGAEKEGKWRQLLAAWRKTDYTVSFYELARLWRSNLSRWVFRFLICCAAVWLFWCKAQQARMWSSNGPLYGRHWKDWNLCSCWCLPRTGGFIRWKSYPVFRVKCG